MADVEPGWLVLFIMVALHLNNEFVELFYLRSLAKASIIKCLIDYSIYAWTKVESFHHFFLEIFFLAEEELKGQSLEQLRGNFEEVGRIHVDEFLDIFRIGNEAHNIINMHAVLLRG